jgi:hypothetical protein
MSGPLLPTFQVGPRTIIPQTAPEDKLCSLGPRAYPCGVSLRRFRKVARAKDPAVSIGDPRLEGWETVSTFEELTTSVAWRDRLREMDVDACCVADQPLDQFGRGDIYLVVPPEQWSRANEIVENLDE